MKSKKYDLQFKEGETSFFVEVAFPKTVSRKRRKRYSLKIHHALKNLNDLCTETLEFSLGSERRIKVSFKEMKDYSGLYISETKEIFLHSIHLRDISGVESTFFHEMIHTTFDSYFGNQGYLSTLSEGAAYYFENKYYPYAERLSAGLLRDRASKKKRAPGFYFMKRLVSEHIEETKALLKNVPNAEIKMESILESMKNDEKVYVNTFLYQNADFIITDSSTDNSYGFACIYREKQVPHPVLFRIDQAEIAEFKERNHIVIKEDLSESPLKDFQGGVIPEDVYLQFENYYSQMYIEWQSQKLLFPKDKAEWLQFFEQFLPQEVGESRSFSIDPAAEILKDMMSIKPLSFRCTEIFNFIAE